MPPKKSKQQHNTQPAAANPLIKMSTRQTRSKRRLSDASEAYGGLDEASASLETPAKRQKRVDTGQSPIIHDQSEHDGGESQMTNDHENVGGAPEELASMVSAQEQTDAKSHTGLFQSSDAPKEEQGSSPFVHSSQKMVVKRRNVLTPNDDAGAKYRRLSARQTQLLATDIVSSPLPLVSLRDTLERVKRNSNYPTKMVDSDDSDMMIVDTRMVATPSKSAHTKTPASGRESTMQARMNREDDAEHRRLLEIIAIQAKTADRMREMLLDIALNDDHDNTTIIQNLAEALGTIRQTLYVVAPRFGTNLSNQETIDAAVTTLRGLYDLTCDQATDIQNEIDKVLQLHNQLDLVVNKLAASEQLADKTVERCEQLVQFTEEQAVELHNVDDDLRAVQQQNEEHRQSLAAQSAAYAELEAIHEQLAIKASTQAQSIIALKEQEEELTQQTNTMTKDHKAALQNVRSFSQDIIHKLETKLTAAEDDVSRLNTEILDVIAERTALRNDIEQMEEECAKLNKELQAAEQHRQQEEQSASKKRIALEDEIVMDETQIRELISENNEQAKHIQVLDGEKRSLEGRVEHEAGQMLMYQEATQTENEQLKAEILSKQQLIHNIEAKAKEADQRAQDLVEELKKQNEALKVQNSNLEAAVALNQRNTSHLLARLDTYVKQVQHGMMQTSMEIHNSVAVQQETIRDEGASILNAIESLQMTTPVKSASRKKTREVNSNDHRSALAAAA